MSSLKSNVELSRYNIWGIGGPARQLAEPASAEELAQLLPQLKGSVQMIGMGSNLLALDEGYDGTVIATPRYLRELRREEDGAVYAQCGVSQARLARFLATEGLGGGEFFATIPGTVGGALAMNAGAYGGETWAVVHSVDVIDRQGRITTRAAADFDIGYRRAEGLADGEFFLAARMKFATGDTADIKARIQEMMDQRRDSQPTGQRCCGSVFLNPSPLSAGRLIDECGLKGQRVGAAEISAKHANFIINTGGASAQDVLELAALAQTEVLRQHRQLLRPEFRILAEDQALPPWPARP